DGRGPIAHLPRGIGGREFGKDHRHDRFLPKGSDLLLGRIRKQGGAALLGFGYGASEGAGFMHGVSIGEQQPLPSCDFRARRHGVVLARPGVGERRGGDDRDRRTKVPLMTTAVARGALVRGGPRERTCRWLACHGTRIVAGWHTVESSRL